METKDYRDRVGKYHQIPLNIVPKKRESAHGIYFKENKVLLVKPTWANRWEFPGGGREKKESLGVALEREFKEETGSEIISFEKLPLYSLTTQFYADDINEYFNSQMNFFKIIEIRKGDKKARDLKEIRKVKEVSISELNNKNMHPLHLRILKKLT